MVEMEPRSGPPKLMGSVLVLVVLESWRAERFGVDFGQVSTVAFVPQGLNDSSLAVYCLGIEKKSSRPVTERYDWDRKEPSAALSGEHAS